MKSVLGDNRLVKSQDVETPIYRDLFQLWLCYCCFFNFPGKFPRGISYLSGDNTLPYLKSNDE